MTEHSSKERRGCPSVVPDHYVEPPRCGIGDHHRRRIHRSRLGDPVPTTPGQIVGELSAAVDAYPLRYPSTPAEVLTAPEQVRSTVRTWTEQTG